MTKGGGGSTTEEFDTVVKGEGVGKGFQEMRRRGGLASGVGNGRANAKRHASSCIGGQRCRATSPVMESISIGGQLSIHLDQPLFKSGVLPSTRISGSGNFSDYTAAMNSSESVSHAPSPYSPVLECEFLVNDFDVGDSSGSGMSETGPSVMMSRHPHLLHHPQLPPHQRPRNE
ncbi:hypothetical protein PABG_07109 [Paracoccidioides brasiliensis Pb03]|nr:hypothetical protein PABG_07109 [Paracoccidioides brasiliensis Pb03]